MPTTHQNPPAVLAIRNLLYRPAVKDVEGFCLTIAQMDVAAGERVAIVGPSGVGKSTLLNLIAAALPVTSGSIALLGDQLNGVNAAQADAIRGAHMGLMFQTLNLLPFASAKANVEVAGTFAPQKRQRAKASGLGATALLHQLGLDDARIHRLPARLLSIGQQQRVAAARALYGSPSLILADEPTSALDAKNRDGFLRLLFSALDTARQSLLVVTHDPIVAQQFDRVIDLGTLTGEVSS